MGGLISTISFTLDFSGIDLLGGGSVHDWANVMVGISGGYGGYSDSRLKDNIRFVHDHTDIMFIHGIGIS